MLIRDLFILSIFESPGLCFPRKDSHSVALSCWMSLFTLDD